MFCISFFGKMFRYDLYLFVCKEFLDIRWIFFLKLNNKDWLNGFEGFC